ISHITEGFASAEATKGLSGRPLETFGPLLRMGNSTRNRFLEEGKGRAFLAFHVSQRVSPLRRRPKGFPVALWKPSALCCVWGNAPRNRVLVEGRRRAFLAFHASQRVSPQRRRPKGCPVALWKPSALCCAWGIPQETDSLWQARKRPAFPPAPLGAPSPKPNTG